MFIAIVIRDRKDKIIATKVTKLNRFETAENLIDDYTLAFSGCERLTFKFHQAAIS